MKSITLDSLPPLARELAEESLAWMEPFGDGTCHLMRYPGKVAHYGALHVKDEQPHLIRESVWWAIGLLLRNKNDDAARGGQILEACLHWQFNEPGQPYHGTFHRSPQEKLPPAKNAVMWNDYDPNWRQFIGTSFLLILEKLSDRLSPALEARLKDSIRLAVEGEPPDRIVPCYSNIAMMQVVLLVQAGARFHQPAWKEKGLALAREVYGLFAMRETFSEYNSPTYYGVILYALRFWQLDSCGPEIQAWGAEMEAALWRHVARYYRPGLRNICGPFDRAYGMDMTKYCSGIGLWMRLELEPKLAPFPLTSGEFHHRHDFPMAQVVAILGTEIPEDARLQLREIPGERTITEVIESEPALRTATACLKADRMWGAESGWDNCRDQFHPVTAHWLQPDGTVGWLRLENKAPVDAVATIEEIGLTTSNGAAPANLIWHLSVNARPIVTQNEWQLPGMLVRVKTTLPVPMLATSSAGLYTLTQELAPSQKAALQLEFHPANSRVTCALTHNKMLPGEASG